MPSSNATPQLHSAVFKAMGSRCEIQLYGPEATAKTVADRAVERVRALEAKYSRYRADNVTARINAAAGSSQAIEVDPETAALLDYAAVLHEQSDGLFDITSGVLRKAWDFKAERLPTEEQIATLLPLIGWSRVEWQAPFVRLPEAGMELDFGGYVKEYTADCVADLCRASGIEHGLVNLGGDIHVIGPHPDGSPWQVGIQHPRQPNSAIARIPLAQGAIATSGDYERYMMVDGTRYCHLLHPATGHSLHPAFASISVVAARCLIAGSFTTIALLKSPEEPQWLSEQGLPYLTTDQQLQLGGSLDTGARPPVTPTPAASIQ